MTMKEKINYKDLYNKVSCSLRKLDDNNLLKYDKLFELYDSVINNHLNKRIHNQKLNYNFNSLTTERDSKSKNIINEIINDKLNTDRINLFHKTKYYKSIKTNQNEEPLKNNFKYNFNLKKNNIFLTTSYIQKNKINSQKKKKEAIHLGKSLNDVLIHSINDEMINKGILIQIPISTRKRNYNKRPTGNNFNNYETHMDIFGQKMKSEFDNYLKKYKLSKKKTLKNFSKEIAQKKENIIKNIPIYIKGYKKDPLDIFHTRNIFDLEYQKIYRKPSINIDEILHYQNKNSYDFKKGKIPFYYFLRTVNNPYDKKAIPKKRPKSGNIKIEIDFKDRINLFL